MIPEDYRANAIDGIMELRDVFSWRPKAGAGGRGQDTDDVWARSQAEYVGIPRKPPILT
jgi:hypothetical protein